MLGLKALTALMATIATVTAAALPQTGIDTPTTGGVEPLVPTEVEVMYYQAPWSPTSESCVCSPHLPCTYPSHETAVPVDSS